MFKYRPRAGRYYNTITRKGAIMFYLFEVDGFLCDGRTACGVSKQGSHIVLINVTTGKTIDEWTVNAEEIEASDSFMPVGV